MFSQVIWITAVALEGLLLIRSFFQGLMRHYFYFYSYIGFVFVQDLLRMFIYTRHPEIYPQVYWSTQFLGLFFGCCVLWEIYRGALSRFPGARRIARLVLGILIVSMLLKGAMTEGFRTPNQAILTTLDTERDLRLVQSVALAALISVLRFYKVSLGRNLRALVLGYGLFLATSVINLAVRGQLGGHYEFTWELLQPFIYVVVLCVWSFGMWSFALMEAPKIPLKVEEDYERLARTTRIRIGELRSRVNKGIRA